MKRSQPHLLLGLVSLVGWTVVVLAALPSTTPAVALAESHAERALESVTLVVDGMMKSRSGAT